MTPRGTPDEARPTPGRGGADPTRPLAERLAAVLRAATEYAIIGTDPRGLITDWSAGAERRAHLRDSPTRETGRSRWVVPR